MNVLEVTDAPVIRQRKDLASFDSPTKNQLSRGRFFAHGQPAQSVRLGIIKGVMAAQSACKSEFHRIIELFTGARIEQ